MTELIEKRERQKSQRAHVGEVVDDIARDSSLHRQFAEQIEFELRLSGTEIEVIEVDPDDVGSRRRLEDIATIRQIRDSLPNRL